MPNARFTKDVNVRFRPQKFPQIKTNLTKVLGVHNFTWYKFKIVFVFCTKREENKNKNNSYQSAYSNSLKCVYFTHVEGGLYEHHLHRLISH
jgi:hypothetical protein